MDSCAISKRGSAVTQLTHTAKGHTLHHNGVFSKDGQWIAFDGRNEETAIGQTSQIGVVSLKTGEEKIIYQTKNPTQYGPGVGAASFSPVADRVLFIHGLFDACKEKPYGFARRTGVAIDLLHPFKPVLMDARDVTFPYTPGSLRGGTHSHCWSPDGKLISFTYNDELTEPDLRTVGVMFDAGRPVITDATGGNNNGIWYAAIIAAITARPKPASDEISKAFDECWLGKNGYTNAAGKRVPYAIAFQGNTRTSAGKVKTEIYLVEVDTSLILRDTAAAGQLGGRPKVPEGIIQRRISHTQKGLSSVRHWLRSSKDGRYIYALAEDNQEFTQIIRCNSITGQVDYMTQNEFSIKFPFNISPDGKKITFIGDNNIYLVNTDTKKQERLTHNLPDAGKITGAPCFSPDGNIILFNQYQKSLNNSFLQIMYIKLN